MAIGRSVAELEMRIELCNNTCYLLSKEELVLACVLRCLWVFRQDAAGVRRHSHPRPPITQQPIDLRLGGLSCLSSIMHATWSSVKQCLIFRSHIPNLKPDEGFEVLPSDRSYEEKRRM